MNVIYKKVDNMVQFSDLEMGDVFKYRDEILMVVFGDEVVILNGASVGDVYGKNCPKFIEKNPQVKKLRIHLVIEE